MNKFYLYLFVAVIVGLTIGKLIWIPIEDKLYDKITVNNKEELKTVIDTIDVRAYKVSINDNDITITYTKPFEKAESSKVVKIIYIVILIILIIFIVYRTYRWAKYRNS